MANDSNMTFRVPSDLAASFKAALSLNDESAGQVFRAAMRAYVRDNAQAPRPISSKDKRND